MVDSSGDSRTVLFNGRSLNSLTESDVTAENKLFATLDTRSRRLRFPEDREVVITEKLLAQLELHHIPRLLVFNKADLLDEIERQRIVAGKPDAVLISANDRNTTMGLLDLIASKLRSRWDNASPLPPLALSAQ